METITEKALFARERLVSRLIKMWFGENAAAERVASMRVHPIFKSDIMIIEDVFRGVGAGSRVGQIVTTNYYVFFNSSVSNCPKRNASESVWALPGCDLMRTWEKDRITKSN